jgi:hypothetical protein
MDYRTWSDDEIKKVMVSLYHGAATDREFRNLCLKNPKAAIEKIAGVEIPEDFKIRFIENAKDTDVTYVLPNFEDDELDDRELAQVSGGRGNPITSVVKIITEPVRILVDEATHIGTTGKFDTGIICASVGVIAMPPGTGVPAGTGMIAGATSGIVDSDYGHHGPC